MNEIKLTKNERTFCEAVLPHYVLARDSDEMGGHLCLYTGYPKYDGGLKVWMPYTEEHVRVNDGWFKFITWDSGCWAISTLLGLEVVE